MKRRDKMVRTLKNSKEPRESPPKNGSLSIDEKGLDLTAALRILRHAGRPDPTQLMNDCGIPLQAIIDALCDLSVHDGLTGLVNATFFHAALSREIGRSARTGRTCCLMVIDADHFKNVNDTYGHHVGDYVLQTLAQMLKQSLRSMDTAARIGGEEFAVILPECSPEDALLAGARIHAFLNPLIVSVDDKTLRLTTSVGLVWADPQNPVDSTTLVSRADQEMYRAKRSGRGRLCHPPLKTTQVSPEERAALASGNLEEKSNDQ
jgi:diguanylate cyclase (GGDEF)-like protein